MMEVIPINTNDNAASKADLWADRFHAFQESGLSRKEWCQQNGIPQSTPVSYTHLDVYKRQGIHGLGTGRVVVPSGIYAPGHKQVKCQSPHIKDAPVLAALKQFFYAHAAQQHLSLIHI